ncbi:MAG TPA: isoprenylcysteine carboxylmethyltransferase family protein [Bryobacteraceae bacterium]|nr:isoprenylcysteine carboxylmethyltransferase family protein [Bryobacteraceae bacterium]
MTRKAWAILGSALFLVIAPGFVAVLVPFWISQWQFRAPFLGAAVTRWAGTTLIALGAVGLLDSFRRFAVEGLGTPAPVAPPVHLVAGGLYRFVRNPMYVAVVSAVLGQALFFANVNLLVYAGCLWLAMHLFVVLYEEPTLSGKFGEEYKVFRTAVPRWIPRLTPWRG